MKYKIIFLTITLFTLVAMTGCEEQKLETYNGDNFVQFKKTISDSTNVSFMFYPGKDYIEFPVVLELVGVASNKDMKYKVVVDNSYTTASGTHYSLPAEQIFHAGRYSDTLFVRLNNTADLKTKKVRLLLRVESSSDLKIGKIEQSAAVIWMTNTLSKPAWWNSDIDSYYLGTYSDKKFELFIQVTGIFDMTGLDASMKRSYALEMKQYLSEHPTLDENNQYIEVPVL